VQQKHLNTLEFSKILERLAGYTAFSASKVLALELRPSPYLAQVRDWQTETTEADRLLTVKVNIGVGGARDVRPYLVRTQRGFVLTPHELLEIRQTLVAARQLRRTITRLSDSYPRLADIAQRIEECPGVVNAIGQALDDHGEIKDSASPTLARIRRNLRVAHDRLKEKLNRIIASSQFSHYLQEALVTQRAGRYVIPLKAEFKGRIQAVIHDQSASGATLFVEPLATVELNNKWRQLQLDEEDEIHRILAELCELVAHQADFISHTVETLAELDLAFAKAKYAQASDAIEPILTGFNNHQARPAQATDQSTFKLISGRHPLLDPETVVPIDIVLDEDTHMLVITGPNTGGKTVSLKTIGLLVAMAQAGLRIPATEGSTLPIFNQILADIGDEQSIEQSLSTFSAHMTNVVHILEACDEQSLIIFDELGAGTDPIEGSALARSILSYLLERNVTTFVATHYSELKAFAHTTSGVTNASMEFDPDSLAPTYRLMIGLPGASNAFTIAQRLGLSEKIINTARGLVDEDAHQIETMLAEIQAQAEAAQRARQMIAAEQEEVEAYKRQLQQQLAEIDIERRDILNSARADARREIKGVRERIREIEARQAMDKLPERVSASPADTPGQVSDIEIQLEALEIEIGSQETPQLLEVTASEQKLAPSGPIQVGDKVFIRQFGTIGQVLALQNKQAEVQLGHFRTTVSMADLELREKIATAAQEPVKNYVNAPVGESPGMELDLRGQVSEDALMHLDQYLDQAFLAQLPWVRIIHGKGSGVLRQVVREELQGHPMISSYRSGEKGEGGDGVTVAKLALG
jgi:DNA mismatch repair protein MutS2